jgi:adenosylcobinamide-phosphate synthase
MDSMAGYKNARYRYFGTAAARLDDVMNFIPARLTALFMILACYLPGKASVTAAGKAVRIPDGAAAYRIWRRDRLKSPSPNSAQTESVCAGALHLRLLGDTWYFGEVHHKAEIGDGGRSVEPEDITRSVRLMNRTAMLMFAAGILLLILAGLTHGSRFL